jgi:cellulose synthase/poly-beta-1,6-N-acetylglucosamine synthase-like glycosyltransferase
MTNDLRPVRPVRVGQLIAAVMVALVLGGALLGSRGRGWLPGALDGLVVAVALLLFAVVTTTLWWMLHAWRDPETQQSTEYAGIDLPPALSFSLVVPVRHEPEHVVRATVDRLLRQRHPRVETILSVGHDDPQTRDIAERIAAAHPEQVRVSVNDDEPKNKPRQLNTALAECRNDVVGVFDAESLAAPGLLESVDRVFQVEHADVVQGAVQLINYRDSWFALRNCLEYRIWFRSRLHAHAARGFVPLGGNTVFVRRELLQAVGGWDADCLAEDCDLGVRLSTLRRKIVVAYSPALVTREETPATVAGLVRQRTRWALGFMQVLGKRDWSRLPTHRERWTAWWTLTQQHFMAVAGLAIPFGVLVAVLAKPPLIVALVTFLPLLPLLAMIAFEAAALHDFGRDFGLRIAALDYLRLVVGTPFYQVLLAAAALRAAGRYYRGDFRWEKTAHSGAHLTLADVHPANQAA